MNDSPNPSSSTHDNPQQAALRTVGGLIFYLGVVLIGLALADGIHTLPFDMPSMWHRNRPLCIGFSIALVAAGWRLQRREGRVTDDAWRPSTKGTRFERVIVYTREGCHLCDDAKAVLVEYAEYLPEIEDVDIETDPDLVSKYGEQIPVVEIDGKVRFRGRVDEVLLRRLIAGTPVSMADEP